MHWRSSDSPGDWNVNISRVSHSGVIDSFLGVCLTILRSMKCQVGIGALKGLFMWTSNPGLSDTCTMRSSGHFKLLR